MTPPAEVLMSDRVSDSKLGNLLKRFPIGHSLIVAASLLGCQAFAASTQEKAPVLALLSDEFMPAHACFGKVLLLGKSRLNSVEVLPRLWSGARLVLMTTRLHSLVQRVLW
jgi:hypothetical protein